MPYYGDALPYYYGGPFSNHSSLMTGTGRSLHSPLSSSRYAPHLSTISESPLAALRRYSPATTISSRPKRVIDTADIDVSTPRALSNTGNDQHRNRLRRDRPTIRIRSQALKDNPALREHYERHEKTVGELLVEKFLIKDKKPESDSDCRPKLYSQVSLEMPGSNEEREDLQEAMQRRVTRRMTRRRSSADIQMDPEQLEREVLFAQAQADALDTLVAEEQAEIEVETRMGTLIRKNLVRSTSSVLGKHESQLSGDEDDEARVKKLAKKVKKRKKTSEKPSPPSESELESEVDAGRTRKIQSEFKEANNRDVYPSKKLVGANGNELAESLPEGKDEDAGTISPTKALKFKIEASNSVGDFSTLWINAGVAEEAEKQRKKSHGVVEQYRDSVRLPAPKLRLPKTAKSPMKDVVVEEHQQVVVLPVKSRYVKDDSRNSVYLTLKSPKIRPETTRMNEEEGQEVDEDEEEKEEEIAEAVDSIDDQSPRRNNGNVDDPRRSTSSLIASKTTVQSRVNKVAKFRSKDITESDIEVRCISELPGGVGGSRNDARRKDGGLQKVSELVSGTSEEEVKKSSSPTDDRGAIVASASIGDGSIFPKDSKLSVVSARTNGHAVDEERNLRNFRDIDGSGESSSRAVSFDDVGAVKHNGAKTSARTDAAMKEETAKVTNDEKKESKVSRTKISQFAGDGGKRIKRSTSELDSSSTKGAVNFERSKSDEHGKRLVDAESSRPTILPDHSESTTANNLPEAPRIDSLDSKHGFNDTVKTRGIESNGSANENVEAIATENVRLNDDSTGSTNISGTGTKPQSIIAETTNESPKILAPNKKRGEDICNFEEDNDEIWDKLKKSASSEDTSDSKNVNGTWKLRNKREVVPKRPSLDDADSGEMRPASPDLKVVPDSPKKSDLKTKKPVVPTANCEKSPQSPIDKADLSVDANGKIRTDKAPADLPKDTSKTAIDVTSVPDDSPKNDIGTAKVITETPKLTNGVRETKPKAIKEIKDIRDNAKPEVPKLKIGKKPETPLADGAEKAKPEVPKKTWKKSEPPPADELKDAKPEVPKLKTTKKPEASPADEGIDFWGEIESQRVAKPVTKPKVEDSIRTVIPIISKDKTPNSSEALDPEVKSNLPPEASAPARPKTAENLVGDEKKTNKIKKKKPVESARKKDQEKPSEETIFERFINGDGGDGKKLQQQQQQQQQSEKSLPNDTTEEKSCEILEVDRFERNLSIIAEEVLGSPVTEELPTTTENKDVKLISSKKEETAETKLNPLRDLVSIGTGSTEKTASKMILPSVESEFGVPEVTTVTAIEPESRTSGGFVPTINIEDAPGTPPEVEVKNLEEEAVVVAPDEEIPEEEQEGPGTPTNEAVDEMPRNITKWTGSADLSLDEPDKDIGPEVYLAAKEAKKQSTRKKTSTKKGSSKKGSVESNSPGATPDSSKKKKVVKKKKSSTKTGKDVEKRTIFEERSESKVSNSSDTTLKPSGLFLRNSPNNSPRNSPKQRPLDLIKMFYTTPASLLTATPRDLSKVKRAKIKKKKHSSRTASASSDSTGSTRSTQSTGTAESTGSTEHEDDPEQKRISSTRSNDSGFDGSPRLSNCDMVCHKKCEKLTGNLCGLNQKLVAEALQALKRAPSQSSDNQRNSDGSDHHHASGRITPPATNLPRFKKYTVMDFNFRKVLGKGSFGKVLLAELRRTDCVYAVKCLKKDVVLEDDDVECTLIERKVLTLATRHPYLCHLFCTFQTDSHLFFVMEYLNGGDLMFHIQKSGRFAECRARFYAAEIWSGLNFLHKKGIVYRDLKLDNVLLDFEGHIRIADFGMCKLQIFLDRTADTFCGTPDYMAPEIIKGLKYNQAVDWWSFGVLLYEMLTGQSPFSGCDEDELFWSICNERPFIPRYLSQEAMDVLVCLLEKDAGKRPPAHEIAVHPFFHALQWERLERRQLEPPFKPALEHTLDTRYFDTAFTAERARLTPVPEQILTSMDQGVFRGFSYTNPNATD